MHVANSRLSRLVHSHVSFLRCTLVQQIGSKLGLHVIPVACMCIRSSRWPACLVIIVCDCNSLHCCISNLVGILLYAWR